MYRKGIDLHLEKADSPENLGATNSAAPENSVEVKSAFDFSENLAWENS
jgi:hypothetical protein